MLKFFSQRLAIALLVGVTVSIIGFGLLRLSGDLVGLLAGDGASPADIARIAALYGLDRPVYVQYLEWAGKLLRGDFGVSLFTNEPVLDLILDGLGVTAVLAVSGLLFSLLLAVPLGMLAAMRPNSWLDRGVLSFAVMGQAIPSFWLALILVYVFGVLLRWLPISGSDSWLHFVLPTVTLGLASMPTLMRLTRSGMVEVLASDYVRTARAKGLGPGAVLFRHALRNAILPVVSISAVTLGFLLGGSVIVESVFALNGLGLLAFRSITRLDFPVVQAIVVFLSLCYIVLTMVADLLNAWIDPRIQP